jgi:SAM-dependent methyltransferase
MKNSMTSAGRTKLSILLVLGALFLSACQTAHLSSIEPTPTPAANTAAAPATIDRPVSEPYKGDLSIFEGAERAKKLQVDRVMDVLKISEGKNVADLGAGSGWFSTLAARRVGERGKVYAIEINQEFINHINERAKKENLKNIQTVLGTEDDPKLAANSIDACLILKTYHEIGQPIKVLQKLKAALKKDGLLGVIDRNGKGDDHGLDKQRVIDEAKLAGFTLKEEHDFTKGDGMDYFLVFQPKN